jgi:exopolysaccharide biosynthesis polyprenyl glycosylphosphotransferase
VSEMEGTPLLTLPRTRIPRSSLLSKRALDIAVSGTLLILLSPLLLLFAIAIRLDSPGPVIFRQRRVGRLGRPFEILKFRSMYRDADSMKHELAELTLHRGASDSGIFKVANDPRVTRVGRVLRRFSLDELPQLLNIVRGDMSLVGPRPLPEDEHKRITGRYRRRIDLMPGLTGLWQVHGRSNIPFEDMVGLDYLYVTNWSLWRDIKLLVRTLVVVVRARGAY